MGYGPWLEAWSSIHSWAAFASIRSNVGGKGGRLEKWTGYVFWTWIAKVCISSCLRGTTINKLSEGLKLLNMEWFLLTLVKEIKMPTLNFGLLAWSCTDNLG